MKAKAFILLVFFIGINLWATTVLAQAEEKKAEEPKPQLYVIWDIKVKPSKVAKYEAATKEEIALHEKYNNPNSWIVANTSDFHYYFLIPAENFAAIDKMFKSFEETTKKAGEEYQKMSKQFAGTYEYVNAGMWYLRPDLSYFPETPRLKEKEAKFVQWYFIYIKVGMEQEAEEVLKKWKALYKSKNISDGYNVWVGFLGVDAPVFVVTSTGKSAADFFNQSEKTDEILGEEAVTLSGKTIALCRKFEHKTGFLRPDLYYTAKKEKPTE